MRSGKELLLHSKQFSCENRAKSWFELFITLFLITVFFALGFYREVPLALRLVTCVTLSLLYVRLFVIYHDYEHRAILRDSTIAHWIMAVVGIYLLAPETIWRRSHEHHHNNNSKLTLSGIGAYPLVSKNYFLSLPKKKQNLYLINRHPITVICGYFTLFIYWLNLKSFVQSPRKHIDSFVSLAFHAIVSYLVFTYFGMEIFVLGWCFPFFMTFGIGSYLFYSQHNFPTAHFHEHNEWAYDKAAVRSTSRMIMSPLMHWFTGNIGYHHVHHLNSRIPFYRLREAMESMPELDNVPTTSWSPMEIIRCLRLKVWDEEASRMITMKQLRPAWRETRK
jgi:omega-6 fatty acid desaturase (delta-12 desaturase)